MSRLAHVPECSPAPQKVLPTREELLAKYDVLNKAEVDRYGIPYLIRQYDITSLSVSGYSGEDSREDDEDHNFYCHDAPQLLARFAGTGGLALRVSRAQTSDRLLHALKHHAHPGGLVRYPETPDEQFAALVLVGGGYVSRRAWDYRDPDNPKLVTLSKREYQAITNQKVLHPVYHPDKFTDTKTTNFSRAVVGMFFAEYARNQDLTFLDESTIDCFVHATSNKRRQKMGQQIIEEAIRQAGSQVDPLYAEAFKEQDAVPNPRLIEAEGVIKSFFYRRRWPDYFDAFESEIRHQVGLPARLVA